MIVFIDGLDLYETPEQVQKAMTSGPALGAPLPITATFDAGLQKKLGVVGYKTMRDANGFTAVKNALAKIRGKKVESGNLVK